MCGLSMFHGVLEFRTRVFYAFEEYVFLGYVGTGYVVLFLYKYDRG